MIHFKKRTLMFIVILSALAIVIVGCNKEVKDAVAKVNGNSIPKEEFDRSFNMYKTAYEAQFGPDIMSKIAKDDKTFEEVIKENIVEMLISEKLILEDANAKKISVSENEIKKQIDGYVDTLGGEEKFKEFLSENDMTQDIFKEGVRKELVVQKHRKNYMNDLNISEEEAKKYFEENKDSFIQVRASHILVESEEEGKKILENLKKGEDFHSLATAKSIDEGSAEKGGDLNYFKKGAMIKEFEEAAFSLKPGELSDLVKTDFGYHIIKVEDRMDTYNDLKDEVIENLKNKKYNEYISQMRKKADVKTYLKENKKDKENKKSK